MKEIHSSRSLHQWLQDAVSDLPPLKRYVAEYLFPQRYSIVELNRNPTALVNEVFGALKVKHDFPTDAGFKLVSMWISDLSGFAIGSTRISEFTLLHLACSSSLVKHESLALSFQAAGGHSACNHRWPGPNSHNLSPFYVAVGTNNVSTVQFLLAKFDPDLTIKAFGTLTEEGYDAMEIAAALQLPEVVRSLLNLRSAYYSALPAAKVIQLFYLSQRQNFTAIRDPRGILPYDCERKTFASTAEQLRETVEALISFYDPIHRLSSLRDPITRQNLLHLASENIAVPLLVAKGVSLFDVDISGKTPWMIALDCICSFSRAGALSSLLEAEFSNSLPTAHFGLILRSCVMIRSHQNVLSNVLMELEAFAWEKSSRDEIEEQFAARAWPGSALWTTDVISRISSMLGSKHKFFSLLKAKQVRFSTSHYYIVDEWIRGSCSPVEGSSMTQADMATAATYAISSFRSRNVTDPSHLAVDCLFRADALARLISFLNKKSEESPGPDLDPWFELANEMIDSTIEFGRVQALILATQNEPRCGARAPRVVALWQRALNEANALYSATVDDDLTDAMRLLVREAVKSLADCESDSLFPWKFPES